MHLLPIFRQNHYISENKSLSKAISIARYKNSIPHPYQIFKSFPRSLMGQKLRIGPDLFFFYLSVTFFYHPYILAKNFDTYCSRSIEYMGKCYFLFWLLATHFFTNSKPKTRQGGERKVNTLIFARGFLQVFFPFLLFSYQTEANLCAWVVGLQEIKMLFGKRKIWEAYCASFF